MRKRTVKLWRLHEDGRKLFARWLTARLSNAIRNCPLCVTKNCPHPRVHDLG
jgi:hypothetical protein